MTGDRRHESKARDNQSYDACQSNARGHQMRSVGQTIRPYSAQAIDQGHLTGNEARPRKHDYLHGHKNLSPTARWRQGGRPKKRDREQGKSHNPIELPSHRCPSPSLIMPIGIVVFVRTHDDED